MAPKAKAKTRAEQTAENRGRTYVAAMDPATRGARPRSARALRRAWHRGEQHPSALRRAALWWALEALRCYPSEVPRG